MKFRYDYQQEVRATQKFKFKLKYVGKDKINNAKPKTWEVRSPKGCLSLKLIILVCLSQTLRRIRFGVSFSFRRMRIYIGYSRDHGPLG